jgi:hypothetical protein
VELGHPKAVCTHGVRPNPYIPAHEILASPVRAAHRNRRESSKEVRSMPQGYCVKERKKVEIKDPVQVTMKNGRPAIQGTCPDCGTKIFKIGKLS